MPLPLLRLPLLVSIDVIKQMSVTQIINLILTSSKVQRLVKISKYPVQLYVGPNCITLKHPMNPDKLEVLIVVHSEMKEHQEQIKFKRIHEQGVYTKWNNGLDGYRRIIDFLVQNFTVKFLSFQMMGYDCGEFVEYVEYPKSRGIKFDKVRIWDSRKKEGIAERVLSACSDASELDVRLNFTPNFTFNGFHEFKMDRLDVSSTNFDWFTVEHMCDLMNCSVVILRNLMYWKALDFNKFLKFWIESTGRLRTVCLFAHTSEFNPEIAMNGINNIELERNTTFQIQRDNGLKARVMFLTTLFSLNVIDA